MSLKILKCGTHSLQNAAMVVAIIDVICTSILLILFVLGSSMMLAFEIIGKSHNATRVLDIVTDDVFGQVQASYNTVREKKDVAEDMGVFLIIMFLTIVDFIISCIFLDGVKSRDANKCQIWLNIRMVIIVVFKIVVLINLVYGTSWMHAIPDMIFTIYRLLGLYIGFKYLRELQIRNKNLSSSNSANENTEDNEKGGNGSFVNLPTIDVSEAGGGGGSGNSSPNLARIIIGDGHGSISSASSVGITTMLNVPDNNTKKKKKGNGQGKINGHTNSGLQLQELTSEIKKP